MKQAYLETVAQIERLHRQFLEVVRDELERLGVDDLNNVQALILYNIGDDELTVGELTQRGCYMGTNVTYNLKKLIEADYIVQKRSPRDRRSVRVRLSERGLALAKRLDNVFRAHGDRIGEALTEDDLPSVLDRLHTLERVWDHIQANGAAPASRSQHAA